jgi:signal transduction histidine kinase
VKSIRAYLLKRLVGGTALVLAVAGIAIYLVVARSLEAQFDRGLDDRLQGFASILFQVGDEVEFEFSQELMPEYAPGPAASYFELRFEDGRLLERSDSLAGEDLVVRPGTTGEPAHWTAPLPDGRKGRYAARVVQVHHVHPEEGPDRPRARLVRIAVARGQEELVAAERAMLASCIGVGCVVLALIGFAAWTAVKRGLEPTVRIAATLDAIRIEDLPASLGAGPMPEELEPVSQKADALIRRVDAALRRERRTTADIAHELRTPISEILTVSEVALRDRHDPAAARRALSTVRDVAWRMGRSVFTLLKLARLEMGAESFERESVDVAEIVRDSLRSLNALARERQVRCVSHVADSARVEGDREAVRIVISNLLSNALYYGPPGGTVECRLELSGAGWRFCVENEAPDLRPEDLAALTDPFWRKDRARTDRSRAGLGLALSRALAERSGMALDFELQQGTFRAILGNHAPAMPRGAPARDSLRAADTG